MRMVFPNNVTGRFFDDLASEMNTFVESVLGDENKTPPTAFAPRMDLQETESHFVAYLDLPGVSPDQVTIDMEDDHVVVSGERIGPVVNEATKQHRVERSAGHFRRIIAVPKTVDRDAIEADYEHGVLTITMPKVVEEKKSRRIVINQNGSTVAEVNESE